MITDMLVACKRQSKSSASSDYGGKNDAYSDGATIQCGIYQRQQVEIDVAGQRSLKTVYDVVTVDTVLATGELIKRTSDSAVFRITSASVGCAAPGLASIAYKQAAAEKVTT